MTTRDALVLATLATLAVILFLFGLDPNVPIEQP